MSDYFGALLRSAGALGAVPAAPRSAAAVGDDIVEQDVEVEAPAPGAGRVRAEPWHENPAAPAVYAVDSPAVDVSTERAGGAREQPPVPPASSDARAGARPAAQPASLPQQLREDPALTHPVVRSALRWVAADPQGAPAPSADAMPSGRDPLPRVVPRLPAQTALAATPIRARPQPLLEPRAETPSGHSAMREVGEIDLLLPTAPRQQPAADGVPSRPAASSARTIDVHIGTIHVAVDAPRPATVPPVPHPAPRPQPQPSPAERGSFSRLRLPRL